MGSATGRGKMAAIYMVMLLVALAAAFAAAGCGEDGGSETTAATAAPTTADTGATAGGGEAQVIMENRSYSPKTVTIKAGQTVTWLNQDAPQHDVVAQNGEFKSELFDTGETFSYTFEQPGTYPYYCSVHPGMEGEVIVE